MVRALAILVGFLIGASAAVIAALWLITTMASGGDIGLQRAMIAGFAVLGGVFGAFCSAWLTASAETNHLAVGPTRQLIAVSFLVLGGAVGLLLYLFLAGLSGGQAVIPMEARHVFSVGLIALGGVIGLFLGRKIAQTLYY